MMGEATKNDVYIFPFFSNHGHRDQVTRRGSKFEFTKNYLHGHDQNLYYPEIGL